MGRLTTCEGSCRGLDCVSPVKLNLPLNWQLPHLFLFPSPLFNVLDKKYFCLMELKHRLSQTEVSFPTPNCSLHYSVFQEEAPHSVYGFWTLREIDFFFPFTFLHPVTTCYTFRVQYLLPASFHFTVGTCISTTTLCIYSTVGLLWSLILCVNYAMAISRLVKHQSLCGCEGIFRCD